MQAETPRIILHKQIYEAYMDTLCPRRLDMRKIPEDHGTLARCN